MTNAAEPVETAEIGTLSEGLDRLVELWEAVNHLHAYLGKLQPVAVVAGGDSLLIFEPDSAGTGYAYRSTVAAPFPMNPGIRAAFPLKATQGRYGCVVGPSAFASDAELVLVLHEFVHCGQGSDVEQEIKQDLTIAREAAERGDYMWELEHPFPYSDSSFVEHYAAMITAFAAGEDERALAERTELRASLSSRDYEYLVWQEWKEGLARYLENRIQEKQGLPVNSFGSEPPFDRIVFYHGGAQHIAHLLKENPSLRKDPRALFEAMRGSGHWRRR